MTTDSLAKHNARVLSLAQAINGSVGPIVISLGGLAGAHLLVTDKSLATLPVSSYSIGLALASIPAAQLMRKIGRRSGFIVGTGVGIGGALTAVLALQWGLFGLFCLGLLVSGCSAAFVQQYRFAAADQGSERFRPKAISWVLVGGVGAAIIGQQTAIATKDWLQPTPFAGAFAATAGLLAVGALVLTQLRATGLSQTADSSTAANGRPLGEIARQPRFRVAVICAIGSYALMSFLMTGAPLAMVHNGHSHANAMLGIQWHVMAMFLPSFITGNLISRLGSERIVAAGLLLLMICAAVGLAGLSLWNFWISLVLLGVGWNFGFIGATAMLTETYRESEKNTVQGLNDFLVFGSVASASLLSGYTLNVFGWSMLNWMMYPVLVVCLLALYWLQGQRANPTHARGNL